MIILSHVNQLNYIKKLTKEEKQLQLREKEARKE